jgi:integrase
MATRLPSGKYRAQVFIGTDEQGRRLYQSFIADTEDEADFEALSFKLGKGKHVERKDITLRAAMRACIESKRGILSPATIQGYEVIERNFGSFLDTPILQITKLSLQMAITQYAFRPRNDGRPGNVSAKTVRNAHGFISSVLRQNGIEIGEIALPQRQEIEYATPFDEELANIFEAVRGTSIEIPVLLAAFCSLRRGEICGLRFSDVDYVKKMIRIDRSRLRVGTDDHIKAPKTKTSRRVVFVTDYILQLIEALPRESEDDYIFNLTPNVLTRRFPEILKQHGIQPCRFHDLRHSFASVLYDHGIDLSYIQTVGGWASDAVMKRVYIQASERSAKEKSTAANSVFERLLQHDATRGVRKTQ